jgi:hypothetical protein
VCTNLFFKILLLHLKKLLGLLKPLFILLTLRVIWGKDKDLICVSLPKGPRLLSYTNWFCKQIQFHYSV